MGVGGCLQGGHVLAGEGERSLGIQCDDGVQRLLDLAQRHLHRTTALLTQRCAMAGG